MYAYVHCGVTDRDRYADAARKDLLNYAVVDAYANQFARAGFDDDVADVPAKWKARASATRALAAIGDAWVDDIQIMGDAAHVRAKVEAYEQAGARPIVFALPWGEDRRATVSATLQRARVGRRSPARRTFALPGPCSRNDSTPTRASSVPNASTNASASMSRPSASGTPEPVVDHALGEPHRDDRARARAARPSAARSSSTSSRGDDPVEDARARAPRRRGPGGRSTRAPSPAPGRPAGPAAACRPRRAGRRAGSRAGRAGAFSAPTRRSQVSASSQPPPSA